MNSPPPLQSIRGSLMETILSLLMMLARRMAGLTRRTIVVDASDSVLKEVLNTAVELAELRLIRYC